MKILRGYIEGCMDIMKRDLVDKIEVLNIFYRE